jgi:hypothetical protein
VWRGRRVDREGLIPGNGTNDERRFSIDWAYKLSIAIKPIAT